MIRSEWSEKVSPMRELSTEEIFQVTGGGKSGPSGPDAWSSGVFFGGEISDNTGFSTYTSSSSTASFDGGTYTFTNANGTPILQAVVDPSPSESHSVSFNFENLVPVLNQAAAFADQATAAGAIISGLAVTGAAAQLGLDVPNDIAAAAATIATAAAGGAAYILHGAAVGAHAIGNQHVDIP